VRKLLPLLVVIGLVPAGPALAVTLAEPTTLAEPFTLAGPGTWTWPVVGPLLRGFDPPDSPFGSGHRGIDIASAPDTPVLATAPGVVSFAGPVGGRLFVTVDHGGGLESTYSFLASLAVRRGAAVVAGQVLGTSGTGHAGSTVPHLHLGVRLDDAYVDPLAYLGPVEVWRFIRLAPLG
jgi:murein DD-endopeptidase MepM/ murein hydrolase activator NlpD